jgi:polyisoprenoid-binding protein YceI
LTQSLRRSSLARLALLAAAVAFAGPALGQAARIDAPAGAYELEKTHVSVTFRVKHLGLSMYTARFVGFDSTLTLDPADPTRSTVVFTIDPMSVRTDFPFPEKEDFDAKVGGTILKGKEHPQMRFQSTALRATGPTTGQLTGNLTMGGVTRPATFDITLNGAMPHPFRKVPMLGFSARGTVKRSDFGLTEYLGPIGDEVEILIEAEYQKAP